MADYIQQQGPAYLAHLLKRLSDHLVEGASIWYPQVGVRVPPRTTSTLLALDDMGPLGITEIAACLRQSHPLVITWVKQLQALGCVESRSDPDDGRRTLVHLTRQGRREVERLRTALLTMERASRDLMDQAGDGLFEALWRMEAACREQAFAQRLAAFAAPAAGVEKTSRTKKAAKKGTRNRQGIGTEGIKRNRDGGN
ncbi:winged helix-turn-helix transcriptional regulator [Luteimonas viscosa]|uniref:Winged helix-turn-helix transcriptional regulator n=1 Tax=Luteimonas viscosa TaxID=1132694 RepID=A0A5D4XQQ0_9GAMM|nr:MarR family winged helix-turn-helix transcriptional regulator [Luteimonas viscosa]TYT27007.1 winged helix-turn-helix transcriptional regulator [Luteimonas viscosa]